MRSVDGTTQAAKTASLERGMEAAFVFATADRAAAMLKVGVHTCDASWAVSMHTACAADPCVRINQHTPHTCVGIMQRTPYT